MFICLFTGEVRCGGCHCPGYEIMNVRQSLELACNSCLICITVQINNLSNELSFFTASLVAPKRRCCLCFYFSLGDHCHSNSPCFSLSKSPSCHFCQISVSSRPRVQTDLIFLLPSTSPSAQTELLMLSSVYNIDSYRAVKLGLPKVQLCFRLRQCCWENVIPL